MLPWKSCSSTESKAPGKTASMTPGGFSVLSRKLDRIAVLAFATVALARTEA